MIKSRNEFITRQLSLLKESSENNREPLDRILAQVLSSTEHREAMLYFDKTQSVAQTLNEFNLSDLAPDMISQIVAIEKKHQVSVPLQKISNISGVATKVYEILTLRLVMGLTYSLALTCLATVVFYIISAKVLVQFEEVFVSFGADLPQLTQLAINWQHSYFPPTAFALLMVIFVGFILFQAKNLNRLKGSSKLKKLPFIHRVFDFVDSLTYLTQIKLLLSAGLTYETVKTELPEPPSSLKQMAKYSLAEIEMAEALGNVASEIDFQIDALSLKAENVVVSACRSLLT
ncbi:MAG: hypothetical protein OQK04_14730, partial [Kangiellaceae bacterium]|nr:hypothetical protein [Kangiellaceae bacterium]